MALDRNVAARNPAELREFDQSWGSHSDYVYEQHKAFEWMARRDHCPFCSIMTLQPSS